MASSTKKKKKLNPFLWVVEPLMDESSYLQKPCSDAKPVIFMGGWFCYLIQGQSLGMGY
jgi:hypothetical protein